MRSTSCAVTRVNEGSRTFAAESVGRAAAAPRTESVVVAGALCAGAGEATLQKQSAIPAHAATLEVNIMIEEFPI